MAENTENGMKPPRKPLRLKYNNYFFDLLLDSNTYDQLINDKKKQDDYAKMLFESNIHKRKRPDKNKEMEPSKFSIFNNVGHNPSVSCSSKQSFELSSNRAEGQTKKLSLLYPNNKDPTPKRSFELFSNRAEGQTNKLNLLYPNNKDPTPKRSFKLSSNRAEGQTNKLSLSYPNNKDPTPDFQESESESEDHQSLSLLDPRAYLGTPSTSNKENLFKWDNNSIKLLLHIRLGMEKEFCMPSCKKKKLWDKVASQLHEVLGLDEVSADACDSKYRNLLGTYRVNKRKQNTTGEGAIKWDFFEIMDEVLGHKASSAPPKNLLGCTMDSNTSIEEIHISDEESASDASFTSTKKKKKEKEELSLKRYLYLKYEKDREKQQEQKEREEKKWDEKRELKLKEIEAINNLATAIMNSNKNQK